MTEARRDGGISSFRMSMKQRGNAAPGARTVACAALLSAPELFRGLRRNVAATSKQPPNVVRNTPRRAQRTRTIVTYVTAQRPNTMRLPPRLLSFYLTALLAIIACRCAAVPDNRFVDSRSGISFVLIRSEREFYRSETEVTVAQFRRFVSGAGYTTDAERGVPEGGYTAFAATSNGDRMWHSEANWQRPFPNIAEHVMREDHPVVVVSWNDAKRFCDFFGYRLPTEAEWIFAHAAAESGNVADRSAAQRFPSWNSVFSFDDGAALLAPVRSYRPNGFHVYDTYGNVAEWCADAYDRSVTSATSARVVCGSSWIRRPVASRSRGTYGHGATPAA